MELHFGFGNGEQIVNVRDDCLLDMLTPGHIERGLTGESEVKRALLYPIGTRRLRDLVKPGEKIAIITSDITRPMPTNKVMPAILEELYSAGVDKKDITLIFALGNHRKHTEEERKKLAGERVFSEITCIDSDASDIVCLGTTTRGTPVDVFRAVVRADRRICLGNIEFHYFVGYSGGAKAIMPGVSTRAAIQNNHSFMTADGAYTGNIDGNPVREDIEEAVGMIGVDFILNVVLDEKKEIVKAVAGDVTKAHREGCAYLNQMYRKEIQERADIVFVSQGGAPKDLNLYQMQKALDNAKHAVKKGGVIILIGACKEGLGDAKFEEWMTCSPSPDAMIERIQTDFVLGGHKAAAVAMVLKDADIYLVSEMEPDFVKNIFLTPFSTAEKAYAAAKKKMGERAGVIAMPFGGSTLPYAKGIC